MPVLHRAAAAATDAACATFGRHQVARTARFVFRRACLDVPNDLRTNGELGLQRQVLYLLPAGQRVHVVDVGANVGRWSAGMLTAVACAGRIGDLDLHALEPASDTFRRLSENLAGRPVTLARVALSERAGSAALYLAGPAAGRNSLLPPGAASPTSPTTPDAEEVLITTLDAYASGAGLDRIDLLKIDAEGHDLAVLRGAGGLLARGRILVAQFEYNCRWVDARFFLRDVFDLVQPFGYRVGKLTPRGVEFYDHWQADLETFVEGNYVACAPEAAGRLPTVAWRQRRACGQGV
jgi:FkbM family methyltransferase